MIIPVRCFSCGTVIAHKWEEYQELVSSGVEQADAMDQVGLERYCCRRMYVAHLTFWKMLQYTVLQELETIDLFLLKG